ncbi:MAG: mechanosensitive ion channel family protein [Pseudomonadota bacterium]
MGEDTVTIILPEEPSPELLNRLHDAFPDAAVAQAEAVPETTVGAVAALETALAQAIGAAPGLPGVIGAWLAGLPDGAMTFVYIALALILGYGLERGIAFLVPQPAAMPTAPGFAGRLKPAFLRTLRSLALLCVFAFAARFFGRTMLTADPSVARLGLGVLIAILFARLLVIVFDLLAAPNAPARRLMGFSDAEAQRAFGVGLRLALAGALINTLYAMVLAAAPGSEGALALATLALIRALVTSAFFWAIHAPVARLIAGREPDEPDETSTLTRWLASNWSWFFIGFALLDFVLKLQGILGLLDADARSGAGPVIFVLSISALSVAALRILRVEWLEAGAQPWIAGMTAVAEGVLAVAAALLLLALWGIDPFSAHGGDGTLRFIPALVEALIVIVVGAAMWRAVMLILQARDGGDGAETEGDGMGAEGSRVDTVLPILRGFALAAIGITTIMTALAALGANIGPLIASAGVVGLAVGFGAQKLVSDVISGVFYLYEDAFRMGEYIVTGAGKGTVERISIRSAMLRHHNGPIYTIPFSEMGTIQNHSRDYVVMKFTFMVPDETDLEMIRKLVKKAGQEMAADPELEGKLIAPLKSQGAIAIQGRNYEIGCKFTARPGQQFVIRRKAYAVLQKALRDKGIELSAPSFAFTTDGSAPGPGGSIGPIGTGG